MFGSLIFFGVLAAASATYETTLQEGVEGLAIRKHETVGIPDKQCSGYITSPDDYECHPGTYLAVLKVTVSDDDASPVVKFSEDLGQAFIYRKGFCSGESIVEVSWTCLPWYLNRVNRDSHRAGLSKRGKRDAYRSESRLRAVKPIPNNENRNASDQ